jgi:short-subunit dehydrogenase
MKKLQDKNVVVIGGSSGIGYEIARQAKTEGANLIIAGRDQAKLAAAVSAWRGSGNRGGRRA